MGLAPVAASMIKEAALMAPFSPQECAPAVQGFVERSALFLCVARQQWVAAKF